MESCYCGSKSFKIKNFRNYFYDGSSFHDYLICSFCGSYYLQDKDYVNTNYDENYYSISNTSTINLSYFRSLRYTSNSGISRLLRVIKPISIYDKLVTTHIKKYNSNVLDFGSGSSFYIKFLKATGVLKGAGYSYDPYSTDPDTFNSYENIPFDHIDLIISNQALEHIVDPKLILEKLYASSKDNCTIIFSVPVVGSVLEFYEEYSYTLQAPDHITILSLHAWIKLLSTLSWKVLGIFEDYAAHKKYVENSKNILEKYSKLSHVKDPTNEFADNVIFILKK